MPSYRLYTLLRDGHTILGDDIEADDDEEAIHLARLRVEHADIELWDDNRWVALVPQDGLAIVPSRPVFALEAS